MPVCLNGGLRSDDNAQEESVFYCVSPKEGMWLWELLESSLHPLRHLADPDVNFR